MASAWLFATFTAIGFVISTTINIGIGIELLVAGIAIAGCIGILLLWVIDLLVYHRLLDSCFIEGLILEDRYPWLPPFRHNMMRTQKGEGVLFRVVSFYSTPVVLLIVVSSGSIFLLLCRQGHLLFAAITLGLSLMLAVSAGIVIRRKTENTSAIKEQLLVTKHAS